MRVEAAMAFGAEKVGQAYALLPQNESEMGVAALRAGFPHVSECNQGRRSAIVIEMVDHAVGRQFTQDKRVCWMLTPFRAGVC
jgi:hypothetical protein